MKLAELRVEINAIQARGNLEADALDVTHDSRQCGPGTVFVAILGEKVDAHRFIPNALDLGAVAVILHRRRFSIGVGRHHAIGADDGDAGIQ